MKAFRFKFETLLKWKKNIVRREEVELAQIRSKIEWFEGRLLSICEEIERTEKELRGAREKGDLEKQNEFLNYLTTLRETHPAIEKAQSQERKRLLEKREKMKRAIIQRKVIENLKQTHYTRHLLTVKKKEEEQLDELRRAKNSR
ncbi:MAG: hypothetical protein S4CHLAM45_01390 [Chlamydiales bacterium]|nr:hypothetical protein [Chlamydiales bacterium]MCH9619459.1 hypothetical protein [Chlamydiales bacterium]MCH9622263.1 hypothetical protein [Chlamydiales bacterium]